MGDGGVSIEAVAEAGDILAEEVGVLLERLTDKVLGSPGAGSIPGVVPAVGGPALAKRTSLAGSAAVGEERDRRSGEY